MQITDVRVRKVAKEGKLKAVVSITMDDEFVVHDIKVIEGEKGMFIAMPSKPTANGEHRDTAHPINSTSPKTKYRNNYSHTNPDICKSNSSKCSFLRGNRKYIF